jgi:hypothetical protein
MAPEPGPSLGPPFAKAVLRSLAHWPMAGRTAPGSFDGPIRPAAPPMTILSVAGYGPFTVGPPLPGRRSRGPCPVLALAFRPPVTVPSASPCPPFGSPHAPPSARPWCPSSSPWPPLRRANADPFCSPWPPLRLVRADPFCSPWCFLQPPKVTPGPSAGQARDLPHGRPWTPLSGPPDLPPAAPGPSLRFPVVHVFCVDFAKPQSL